MTARLCEHEWELDDKAESGVMVQIDHPGSVVRTRCTKCGNTDQDARFNVNWSVTVEIPEPETKQEES